MSARCARSQSSLVIYERQKSTPKRFKLSRSRGFRAQHFQGVNKPTFNFSPDRTAFLPASGWLPTVEIVIRLPTSRRLVKTDLRQKFAPRSEPIPRKTGCSTCKMSTSYVIKENQESRHSDVREDDQLKQALYHSFAITRHISLTQEDVNHDGGCYLSAPASYAPAASVQPTTVVRWFRPHGRASFALKHLQAFPVLAATSRAKRSSVVTLLTVMVRQ